MDAGILESRSTLPAMDALAANLRRIRMAAGMTQAALALRCGLPRATVASLEQPGGNPALATVLRVAEALGVTLDDLAKPPPEHRYHLVPPAEQPEFRADSGRFAARQVSPIASKGVQISVVALQPGCDSLGRPHPEGAQEFFLTLEGVAEIQVADEVAHVPAGTLVQFPGMRRHVYRNRGVVAVSAVSVVVLPLR
jgi:transcriptional regulator with XRE-family HTH domain